MRWRRLACVGVCVLCAQLWFLSSSPKLSRRLLPRLTSSAATSHAAVAPAQPEANPVRDAGRAGAAEVAVRGSPVGGTPLVSAVVSEPSASELSATGLAPADAVGAPADAPAAAAAGLSLGTVQLPAPPATLIVAFANHAMCSYALNWLMHVRNVSALRPYVLVTLDAQMQAECDRRGEPCVSAALLHRDASLSLDGASYLRNDVANFKKLGKVKALFTERLLAEGYDVLLSDVDSVWLADPFPFLGGARTPGLAQADLLVTNDYADVRRDDDITTVFNTGALLLRAGPRALAFVREWALRTELTGLIGNDQTELNRLVTSQYKDGDTSCRVPDCLLPRTPALVAESVWEPGAPRGGGGAGGDERAGGDAAACSAAEPCVWRAEPSAHDAHTNLSRVDLFSARAAHAAFERRQRALGRAPVAGARARVAHWMWGGRLRVGLLPMDAFMQGHTFFVQRLHEARGSAPVHVHATYTLSADYGKRWRLRSAGLWQADASAHYRDGSFLHVVGVREAALALLGAQTFPEGVWRCARGEDASRFFDGVPPDALAFARPPPAAAGGGAAAANARATAAADARPPPQLCYHPTHFVPQLDTDAARLAFPYESAVDPARPHVRLQHLTRLLLRNALALAGASGRRLVLPMIWCMCDRYWWHLRDCRMPGAEGLRLPFECPLDLAFNIDEWEQLELALGRDGPPDRDARARGARPPRLAQLVESSFFKNPQTASALKDEALALTLRVRRHAPLAADDDDARLPDGDGPLDAAGATLAAADARAGATAARPRVVAVEAGSTIERALDALRGAAGGAASARVVRVSAASLLRLAPCGFAAASARDAFERSVLPPIFAGQHSYCGSERNPHLGLILTQARARGVADEQALVTERNCTGNPANAFNKPKVDLGPSALRFAAECDAGPARDGRSVVARVFDTVLSRGAAS